MINCLDFHFFRLNDTAWLRSKIGLAFVFLSAALRLPEALGTRVALRAIMIDVALSILALIAGGLTLELFAAARPPVSNEERAFNFRTDALDTVEELQAGNPS